jgi:hypothetical protein
MKHMRIKIMGIALLMLLFSVSTIYGQQVDKSAEIINNLEQMRPVMLEKLVATIPVKEKFARNKGAATSSCNKETAPNTCTYKFESGEFLSETLNAGGYLVTDRFEDKANNLILETEYTIYNRPLCYNFTDTLLTLSLKVCYPCANNTTSIEWINQTLTNYTTNNTLTWTLDCCGSIKKRILAAPKPMPVAVTVGTSDNTPGSQTDPQPTPIINPQPDPCSNTLKTAIRTDLPS